MNPIDSSYVAHKNMEKLISALEHMQWEVEFKNKCSGYQTNHVLPNELQAALIAAINLSTRWEAEVVTRLKEAEHV